MSRQFSTPDEAEAAFYDAIEQTDMAALDHVWSADENIVCIHPGAPRIEGRAAVLDSFKQMFSQAPVLDFSILDTLYTGNESLAIHLVREEISLDGQLVSIMLATNIYQKEKGSWRMLLHHASPEPDLVFDDELDTYQSFDSDTFADIVFDESDEDADDWDEPARPPVLH